MANTAKKTTTRSMENVVAIQKNEAALNAAEDAGFKKITLESPDLIKKLQDERRELNRQIKEAKDKAKAAKEALKEAELAKLDPKARACRDTKLEAYSIARYCDAGNFSEALKVLVHLRKHIEEANKEFPYSAE